MRQFKRADRLGEQLRRDISEVVDNEYRTTAPGLITFTHVRLTGDLRYATIYYSVLGDEHKRTQVLEFLERTKKHIRSAVGTHLHMRRIPEFAFKFDPSIEEGIKIERLLNEINRDKEQ